MKLSGKLLVLSFLLTFIFSGCAEDTPGVTYKLPPTTKVITANEESSVLSIEDDGATIILDGDSDWVGDLSNGDVLLFTITSKTPNGLLRKITSLSQSGGDVLVETEQATMEEAFEELSLSVNRHLLYTDMQSYESSLSGLSIKQSALTIEGGTGGSYKINFDDTVLYDEDGNSGTTSDQIVADGSITLSLELNLEIGIALFSLKRVKIGSKVGQKGELKVSTNVPVLGFDEDVVIANLYFAPFPVGPVVITPQLELVMNANGELNVEISTSVTEEVSVSSGAVYDGGSWSPYSNQSSDWSFTPPTLTATANLKAGIGPRFNLMIYAVAGPYAEVSTYLRLDADVSKNPWWELYAGIEGFVGVTGKILSYDLFEYTSGDLINYKKLLGDAGGPIVSNCGDGTCDPGESCITCSQDCGQCVCGNGSCDPGESCASCPQDCGQCVCGDGTCDPGESCINCPQDCSSSSDECCQAISLQQGEPLIYDTHNRRCGPCALGEYWFGDTVYGQISVAEWAGSTVVSTQYSFFCSIDDTPSFCNGTPAGASFRCTCGTGDEFIYTTTLEDNFFPFCPVDEGCDPAISTDPFCSNCLGAHFDYCGNGALDPGEDCDDVVGLKPCTQMGYPDSQATISCTDACRHDCSNCLDSTCPNGQLDPGEDCDGSLGQTDCISLGFFGGGPVECVNCRYDTSACTSSPTCGNGTVEEPVEQCDQTVGGFTCQSLGCFSGTLGCLNNCTFNLNACTDCPLTCGDEVMDSPREQCDGSVIPLSCVDIGCNTGFVGCTMSCTFDTSSCSGCP